MKKMLLATTLALLITGCTPTDVYCSKQTGGEAHQRKPSPIISSFHQIGQKKTVDAAKEMVALAKMLLKQKQQTFVNGLLGFITLGIYTPLEAHVYCSQ